MTRHHGLLPTLLLLAACDPAADTARQVAALRTQLLGNDVRVKLRALQSLARLGPAATPAVPEVVAQLRETRLRHAATRLLAGLDATAVVPELVRAMRRPELQPHARRALGLLERAAIPGLCEALRTLEPDACALAVQWLVDIGLEVVPAMADLCADPRGGPWAAQVLDRLDFWTLPALLDHLARRPLPVRQAAVAATRRYGWMLARAQDFFLVTLASPDPQFRGMAAVALAMGGSAVVPALLRGLDHPPIAAGCEQALLAMGAEVVPALRAARQQRAGAQGEALQRILDSLAR